jgi:diguanylate cyclase (GGDEF)-like protein
MVRSPSWLCPTADHRERFLDMQRRVQTARLVTIICGVALMLVYTPRGGWPIPVFGTLMMSTVLLGGIGLERRAKPELWVFVTTVLNIQVLLTVASALTGGPRTSVSCLLAAPVLMVGARFSNRGLIVGAPISFVLVLVATVGVDPGYAARHPESVAVPLMLVIITAAYVSPMVASDLRHRADSTLDPLTGLLNRRSLETRVAEVTEQAAMSGQPVSVVALDVDHFKAINDVHGHPAGDVALREIADALRRSLRTFELLYRVGGDEFLLLLPGAATKDAAQIAESLRRAVAQARPLGVAVTCSCGVATAFGQSDSKALTANADAALYRAKDGGRNRVELHVPLPSAAAA